MVPKPSLPPSPNTTKKLNPQDKTFVQEFIGTILYYARAIELTLHVTLGTLGTQQALPTKFTSAEITHLLNYVTMHHNTTICYYASGMILHIHKRKLPLREWRAITGRMICFLSSLSKNSNSPPTLPHRISPTSQWCDTHSIYNNEECDCISNRGGTRWSLL